MADVRNARVWMNIGIGGQSVGKVTFELYNDITPKTAENFRALCTGERGTSELSRAPLHFKGSVLHRIIPGFMAQGGDFTRGDGTGGESIYGPRFRDENFVRKHTGRGLLSMANAGPDTNGSQFFITFRKTPHLDGKHVVFGRVINGMGILDVMEKVSTGAGDRPLRDVSILDCGEVPESEPVEVEAAAPATTRVRVRGAEGAAEEGQQHSRRGASEIGELGLPQGFGKRRDDTTANKANVSVESALAGHIRKGLVKKGLLGTVEVVGADGKRRERPMTWLEQDKARQRAKEEASQAAASKPAATAAATAATAAGDGAASAGGDQAEGASAATSTGTGDALSGLTPAQRRLVELRKRLNAGRRSNAEEVMFEAKELTDPNFARNRAARDERARIKQQGAVVDDGNTRGAAGGGGSAAAGGGGGGGGAGGRRRAGSKRRNKDPDEDEAVVLLHETAASAQARVASREAKRRNVAESYSWRGFTDEAVDKRYEREVAKSLPGAKAGGGTGAEVRHAGSTLSMVVPEAMESLEARDGVNPRGVESLAAGIAKQDRKMHAFARLRAKRDGETVDYINEKNMVFNRNVEKALGSYSADIKRNLERGTAL